MPRVADYHARHLYFCKKFFVSYIKIFNKCFNCAYIGFCRAVFQSETVCAEYPIMLPNSACVMLLLFLNDLIVSPTMFGFIFLILADFPLFIKSIVNFCGEAALEGEGFYMLKIEKTCSCFGAFSGKKTGRIVGHLKRINPLSKNTNK